MSATHPTDVAAVDTHGHDDHDHKHDRYHDNGSVKYHDDHAAGGGLHHRQQG